MNSVEFLNKRYDSISQLAFSMENNWREGRQYLFSSRLRKDLKNAGAVKASNACLNYEIRYREHPLDADRQFLRWLICEGKQTILVYSGKTYGSLDQVMEDMFTPKRDEKALFYIMLQMQLWEVFATNCGKSIENVDRIHFVENQFRKAASDEERLNWLRILYVVLKEDKTFLCEGKKITSVQDLSQHLQKIADTSWSAFQDEIHKLYIDETQLRPAFAGWLINQGYQDQLQAWIEKYRNTDEDADATPNLSENHVVDKKALLADASQIESRFTTLLKNRSDVLKNTDDLVIGLQKVLPDNKDAVELLVHAYVVGIVEAIDHAEHLNKIFVERFTMLLQKNFKDDETLARWAVSAWCRCYGVNVKHYRFEL